MDRLSTSQIAECLNARSSTDEFIAQYLSQVQHPSFYSKGLLYPGFDDMGPDNTYTLIRGKNWGRCDPKFDECISIEHNTLKVVRRWQDAEGPACFEFSARYDSKPIIKAQTVELIHDLDAESLLSYAWMLIQALSKPPPTPRPKPSTALRPVKCLITRYALTSP